MSTSVVTWRQAILALREATAFAASMPAIGAAKICANHVGQAAKIEIQLHGWNKTDQDKWESILTWARHINGTAVLSQPNAKDTFRELAAVGEVLGVRVRVWQHAAPDFEPAQPADALAAALLLETAGAGSDGQS